MSLANVQAMRALKMAKDLQTKLFNPNNLWTAGDSVVTGAGSWVHTETYIANVSPGSYTLSIDSVTNLDPAATIIAELNATKISDNSLVMTKQILPGGAKITAPVTVLSGQQLKVNLMRSTASAAGSGTTTFSGIKVTSATNLANNMTVTVAKTDPPAYTFSKYSYPVNTQTEYVVEIGAFTGNQSSTLGIVQLINASGTKIGGDITITGNKTTFVTTVDTDHIDIYFYLTFDKSATGNLTATYSGVNIYATITPLNNKVVISELNLTPSLLSKVNGSGSVDVVLPSKMYFVKDKQSCLYYENILLKNLNDPTSLYFNAGTNYNRLASFKFTSAATSQTMTAQVIRNLVKGTLKTITYDVIDSAVNNGKTTNILCIGDSFTDIGMYVKELKTLLNGAGVTVNQIGTCGDSTFKAEGLSGGRLTNTFLDSSQGVARIVNVTGVTKVPATGYPGQTYQDANGKNWIIRGGKVDGSGNGHIVVTNAGAVASDFTNFPTSGTLTKQTSGEGDTVINYTNPVPAYFNPFINPSTGVLDIGNYITYWGFNTPNIVVFQFTWNDTVVWDTDTNLNNLVNNFKTAADHVHSVFPNAKVIFSIEPCGSVNGNKDWNGKKYTVLRFTQLLLAMFENNSSYNTWLKIAPSYAFVDAVYGYSTATVTPSERYTITEQSGGDGVHPATVGMQQIADCLYPIVQSLL